MSATETLHRVGNYADLICLAHGHRQVLYLELGSYQGDWLLATRKSGRYFLWRGSYGSCSGCDRIREEFDGPATMDKIREGAKDYETSLEMTREQAMEVAEGRTMLGLLPANFRESSWDEVKDGLPGFARELELAIMAAEGIRPAKEVILEDMNAETQQLLLRAYGAEEWIKDMVGQVVQTDGDNSLLRAGGQSFAFVKDTSTPRRYLLRVPDNVGSVREAIAWTFGMTVDEYKPLIES